jgi:hypothetical protein
MIPVMPAAYNRAVFLRAAAASATWMVTGGLARAVGVAQPAAPATGAEARIARIIADYDGQGMHRTATPVDDASAGWLMDQARACGAVPAVEAFALDRVDVVAALVEAADRRVEGLPFFDGTFTDAQGIRGTLGEPSLNPAIVLVRVNAAGIQSEGRSIEALRRSSACRAIIVISDGAHAGLSPSNAFSFAAPYGVPVLQVGSEHGTFLEALAKGGGSVRFVAHATRTRTQARNVIATIAGQQPALAPVVVMTPRSGWWQCASERGGGLACWLEIARAMSAARVRRPFLLLASSGHELGHLGLDSFLADRAALVKSASMWIHLGANIGAAGGTVRLQSSDTAVAAMADATIAEAGGGTLGHVPIGSVPGGEARNIHVGGGRYVSLLGSGPYFHSQADRWPAAVDVPVIARFASALQALAIKLGNQA